MTDGPSRELEALLTALAAARAGLLAALDGMPAETFVRHPAGPVATDEERWNVRDFLWHAGLLDDWYRLLIDQALGGRPLAAWKPGARPAHIETPELLLEWLNQTRGALLARARRLSDADLDVQFAPPDSEPATPRRLLEHLVKQDVAHASRVQGLLEGT